MSKTLHSTARGAAAGVGFGLALYALSYAGWIPVVEVKAMSEYHLSVRFADATVGEVDMSEFIFSDDAGVFQHLRDADAFAKVRVGNGAVSWPGDLDLAPDAMYDAIVANGHWIAR